MDEKISQLTAYTTPIATDVLPIVDVTNGVTKKIAYSLLAPSAFQIPTGTVDGSNKVFIFATAPNAITVDGAVLQKTEQGSLATQNWTGTTTVTLLVAPTQSCFAIA
jgi:hypothetical protein